MNNFSRIDIRASFDILQIQTACGSCIRGVALRGVKVCVCITEKVMLTGNLSGVCKKVELPAPPQLELHAPTV